MVRRMVLLHPWFLLLLLLVPGAVFLRFARRRRAALRFPRGAAPAALPRTWPLRLRFLPAACYALGLLSLAVALARPARGFSENKIETEGHDIVLLVDTSTSMNATDFSTAAHRLTRLDAAKQVLRRFVAARKDDRLAVIAFAALPYVLSPLSSDHRWLAEQLDVLQTGMLEDGTAIGDAIASAVNRLRDSEAKTKLVVLLTDGIQNAGTLSPADAAEAAAALGIRIYAVGAQAEEVQERGFFGLVLSRPAEIDEAALTALAEKTGGKYFRAQDLATLEKVYEEIDSLETTPIEMQQFTRFSDRFFPWLAAALAFLAAGAVLSATRLEALPA
jgi:Ca-activated chloride channel family protein